ncbi:MAG: DNA-directed RNA polymerase subunit alpha, partial [Planctomycetota bacterium]
MRIRWRNLELPSRIIAERDAEANHGTFIAEPFERGFGHTIANSLRRILLSSLEGAAVTRARIHGVQHEFTTIPGVVEDVTDICLNLKSLVVKNHSTATKTLRIEKHQRGVVTGADVVTDDQVEVINKDLIIATMTDDVPLSMELTVENGRGFVPATEQYDEMAEVGVIPLDAAFSPVSRVYYKVEDTRVGQRTNYDKLTLDI